MRGKKGSDGCPPILNLRRCFFGGLAGGDQSDDRILLSETALDQVFKAFNELVFLRCQLRWGHGRLHFGFSQKRKNYLGFGGPLLKKAAARYQIPTATWHLSL